MCVSVWYPPLLFPSLLIVLHSLKHYTQTVLFHCLLRHTEPLSNVEQRSYTSAWAGLWSVLVHSKDTASTVQKQQEGEQGFWFCLSILVLCVVDGVRSPQQAMVIHLHSHMWDCTQLISFPHALHFALSFSSSLSKVSHTHKSVLQSIFQAVELNSTKLMSEQVSSQGTTIKKPCQWLQNVPCECHWLLFMLDVVFFFIQRW